MACTLDDIRNLSFCEVRGRQVFLHALQLILCKRPARRAALAEAAVRARLLLALALVGQPRGRHDSILRPGKQLLRADLIRRDGIEARLHDRHAHLVGIVEIPVGIERAERVEPHLRVAQRRDRHALTVFEVDNFNAVIRVDDHIARAEAARHPARVVQALFHEDVRIRRHVLCLLDFLDTDIDVAARSLPHLRIHILEAALVQCARLEKVQQALLRERMGPRALRRVDALLVRTFLLEASRRRTDEPAMRRRRG